MVKSEKNKRITKQKEQKKEETILKNKIAYWSKHQELDKFAYNLKNVIFLSGIALISAFVIPFLISFWTKGLIKEAKISILTLLIFYIVFFIYFFREIYSHNRSFRIREAMLRVWYKKSGVNTDKLDFIFEEIKEKYNRKISNKEIENIAREIENTANDIENFTQNKFDYSIDNLKTEII